MALVSIRGGRAFASVLLLLPLAGGCGLVAPGTVPVVTGSVTSGVSVSGTLEHVTEQKIGFPQGGKVTAIKVKVGDRVVPGQPIAEVENLEQRATLRKAQDLVRVEQLKVDQIAASNKADTAVEEHRDNQRQLETARRALSAANKKNRDAIDRVEKRLDFDEDELDRFKKRLDHERTRTQTDEACDSNTLLPGYQGPPTQECLDRVQAAKDAVRAAKAQILQDRADLEDARNLLRFDREDRQLAIDEKRKDRNLAGNNADFEKTDRPFLLDIQRLTLDAAQADLEIAQKAFQDTIKPSFYSGTVDHINGQVGQVLVSSYSLLGPGGGPVKGPAGNDLIVLKDVDAYQVVVPVSEAAGSRITPDKAVEVTFDDIPELTSQARIASIEPPAADAKSKTYMITVVLNQNDPRLKDGLQARVNVALDQVDNTLVVPASAVDVNGRTGVVTVAQRDGVRREVSVEVGMIGDRSIEILSGLQENDQVVADHDT